MNKNLILGSLAGIGAAIIWGLWPVLTRSGVVSEFTPNEIIIIRFLICGFLLLPLFIKNRCYKKVNVFKSLVITAGAGALYVYASASGLKYVPAGHLGIVGTGTMFTLSAIGAYFILGEKKNSWQIFGYIVVLGGMILVNLQNLLISFDMTILYGDSLLALGGALWATYTICIKKWKISSWDAVSIVGVYSLIIFVPAIFIFDYDNINLLSKPIYDLSIQAVGQGVLAAIVALYLFSILVDFLGASKGSIFGAFVPTVAIVGGLIYLGEIPTMLEIIGLAFTTVGMLLILINKKRTTK